MRGAIFAILAGTALAFGSTAANAAMVISTSAGTNPYTGPTPTYNFDPGSRPGGITTGNYQNTTNSSLFAQPRVWMM